MSISFIQICMYNSYECIGDVILALRYVIPPVIRLTVKKNESKMKQKNRQIFVLLTFGRNPPLGGFPAQWARNSEYVPISWRNHDICMTLGIVWRLRIEMLNCFDAKTWICLHRNVSSVSKPMHEWMSHEFYMKRPRAPRQSASNKSHFGNCCHKIATIAFRWIALLRWNLLRMFMQLFI